MKRTGRLLELLSLLNSKKTFTVKELADTFSVSHRTMLRDLHLLSESGVPLQATPGPGGGYSLLRKHTLPPVTFTLEEAVALIISYESFLHYTDKPFEKETLSVISKLFAILPPEATQKIELLRQKVFMRNPRRVTQSPFLRPLLDAALEQQALHIEYDSLQRKSKRIIQPYYMYAFNGYWYCRCFCRLRQKNVSLRVDRILSYTVLTEPSLPAVPQIDDELEQPELRLLVRLTAKGCKLADWHHELGNLIHYHEDSTGTIDTMIFTTDVEWVSRFILGLGQEATVEQPEQVIDYLQTELGALRERYGSGCGPSIISPVIVNGNGDRS
ncbi:UNVERIFIED_CONTAM: putative DNA-binding transcriptional regulator YafY [Brevibacillus sp. OAP136]